MQEQFHRGLAPTMKTSLARSALGVRRKPTSTILCRCSRENSVEAQGMGHNSLTSRLLNLTILEVSGHGLTS